MAALVASAGCPIYGPYGADSRRDLYTVAGVVDVADGVVAVVPATSITYRDSTAVLLAETLADRVNHTKSEALPLCSDERFQDQPAVATCTGALVGEDRVVTAAHCVSCAHLDDVRFVFGFALRSAAERPLEVPRSEIYGAADIVFTTPDDGNALALVRLDRRVDHHRPFRPAGRLAAVGNTLSMLGYPFGLPLKYADGAGVMRVYGDRLFTATLDAYQGNSGSPVFGANLDVVGFLVHGQEDFTRNTSDPAHPCWRSRVYPVAGGGGETVVQASWFFAAIASAPATSSCRGATAGPMAPPP